MKKISIFLMMLCLACFGMAKAQTTVLSENFNSMSSFSTSYSATDWYAYNAGSGNNWTLSTSDGTNSSKCAKYGYNSSNAANCYLVSAPFNVNANMTELKVSLQERVASSSWVERFEVFFVKASDVTNNTSITTATNYTALAATTYSNTSYQELTGTVTNAALAGQSVRLVVHCTSDKDKYNLFIDDITVSQIAEGDCIAPKDLAATTDGVTATLTWNGTAANGFIVNVNGTQVTGQTSPYTFNVALSTTYNITVTADCGSGETSDPISTSFTTPDCVGGHTINYTLNDTYGDGWNGNAILLKDACSVIETLTIDNGSTNSGSLILCNSDFYQFTWQKGSYANETSFTLIVDGTTVYTNQSGNSFTDGQVIYTIGTAPDAKPTNLIAGTPDKREVELSWTENGTATAWEICVNGDEGHPVAANSNPFTLTGLTPDTDYSVKVRSTDGTNESCWSDEVIFHTAIACVKPTDLAQANITINSANLSWTGTSDSYVLQYRPWFQVGEDQQATDEFVTYTYDLSEFSGMGSIAIRHYDVTDMFYLNVDDVKLTNASGSTLFSENFESGIIPSTWTNYDVDGDGYTWDLANSSNMSVNGNYGVYSASWTSTTGALTPDNWLIISNVEMGGTFSFAARGQDPNYPAENFAVYVSLESDITEVPVAGTTYNAENLQPGTPYAWQVKGVCGEDESNWVSALFKTKDDVLVFATDGNWNVLSNWTDGEGNAIEALPTTANRIRIDADAIVPAGYIAEAGKATINGGSITIKDGGQLKHNAATLWVTMEKEITAYTGEKDHYYFISTPFSGATTIGENTGWSHVLNLTSGNYDLYAFDATSELEWINYKAEPTHSEFTAGNNNGLIFKKGYLYANAADNTLQFIGTIAKTIDNFMSDTYEYTDNTNEFNGWKLTGNPFACSAYINYVDDENNVLEADFYTLNADGNGYVLSESNVGLAPLTGALINYSATGTIQFATEAPAKANRTGMLNISLSQGRGSIDQARIRFGQGYNLQHMSFRNSSKLYMPVDNKDYAVVYTEEQGEMPVNFKAESNGTYTLSFNTENVEFGYLHLIDNMNGNDVDLLANPSYTFEAKSTDYESRFKLVFATGNNNEENFAFYSNGNWVINNEGHATLQVVDVNGRILKSESINGCTNINVNAAAGIYMIRLVNGDNVKVQKVVVR